MKLFPAIDLINGQAVRLCKGDYQQKTVYGNDPALIAENFRRQGARYIHIVDLEGARDGTTPNFSTVERILARSGLKAQIGGGIRSRETVEKYLQAGAMRVILGTAAIENPSFLKQMLRDYGNRIAVGVDIKDGYAATHGWLQQTSKTCESLFAELADMGVQTVICTDISKDGLLAGTNLELYRALHDQFPQIELIASGGISSLQNVTALRDMQIPGAILGKALYEGKLSLKQAVIECPQKEEQL